MDKFYDRRIISRKVTILIDTLAKTVVKCTCLANPSSPCYVLNPCFGTQIPWAGTQFRGHTCCILQPHTQHNKLYKRPCATFCAAKSFYIYSKRIVRFLRHCPVWINSRQEWQRLQRKQREPAVSQSLSNKELNWRQQVKDRARPLWIHNNIVHQINIAEESWHSSDTIYRYSVCTQSSQLHTSSCWPGHGRDEAHHRFIP